MDKGTKLKITSLVTKWELDNYAVFLAFSDSRKQKTGDLANKYAEVGDFIERLLYEIPEDLDVYLRMNLDDAEQEFLKSKIGAMWFAKTFMQYNVSQKT